MKPALTTLFKNVYLEPHHSRLCYSQYPDLSEGMRSLFPSGWVRDRGMSGTLGTKRPHWCFQLSGVFSQDQGQTEYAVCWGPEVSLLLPTLTNQPPTADSSQS